MIRRTSNIVTLTLQEEYLSDFFERRLDAGDNIAQAVGKTRVRAVLRPHRLGEMPTEDFWEWLGR